MLEPDVLGWGVKNTRASGILGLEQRERTLLHAETQKTNIKGREPHLPIWGDKGAMHSCALSLVQSAATISSGDRASFPMHGRICSRRQYQDAER
jgi:hypothetical protein